VKTTVGSQAVGISHHGDTEDTEDTRRKAGVGAPLVGALSERAAPKGTHKGCPYGDFRCVLLRVLRVSVVKKTPARHTAGVIDQTSSRTLSERTVRAIFSRQGSPRASDFAKLAACSSVTLGGIGGSNGSTTASTITGPGVFSA
jgi:hypothetical protein